MRNYIDLLLQQKKASSRVQLPSGRTGKRGGDVIKRRLSRDLRSRAGSVVGIIRRTRSIQVAAHERRSTACRDIRL